MAVSQTQLDHFLDFITSTHVIQDLPFGQKSIKLSTKEVITVPNVIRMLVPESIVKQYLAYSRESGFTTLSRTILLRILNVCSASVRKSLQGLDYISCADLVLVVKPDVACVAIGLWFCIMPVRRRVWVFEFEIIPSIVFATAAVSLFYRCLLVG